MLHVLVEKNAKMACLEEGVSLILYSTKQLIQDGTMSQLVPGGLEGKDGTMSQLVPGFLEGKDGTMPWQLQWNFRKPTPSPTRRKNSASARQWMHPDNQKPRKTTKILERGKRTRGSISAAVLVDAWG